jgi:hypothetical protein
MNSITFNEFMGFLIKQNEIFLLKNKKNIIFFKIKKQPLKSVLDLFFNNF